MASGSAYDDFVDDADEQLEELYVPAFRRGSGLLSEQGVESYEALLVGPTFSEFRCRWLAPGIIDTVIDLAPDIVGANRVIEFTHGTPLGGGWRELLWEGADADLEQLKRSIEKSRWSTLEEALNLFRDELTTTPPDEFEVPPEIAGETLDEAEVLCRGIVGACLDSFDAAPPPPRFAALPDGSIDVLWRTDEMSLLLHVVRGEFAGYAGKRPNGETVRGTIENSQAALSHVAAWLLSK